MRGKRRYGALAEACERRGQHSALLLLLHDLNDSTAPFARGKGHSRSDKWRANGPFGAHGLKN